MMTEPDLERARRVREQRRVYSAVKMKIRDLAVMDVRFPTSLTLDGSDAMHRDPDYSAACVVLVTDTDLRGHGFAFTLGRGNEICVAAIQALQPLVVGRSLGEITDDFGRYWRTLSCDTQMRWLGPEKGVVHLALAAVVNAIWDLWAKAEGKPVWKLLADLSPHDLVKCVDFRYITDVLTPDEAVELLERQARGKADREARLLKEGYPAYTTSTGWMGYPDEKVSALCRQALADGWTAFKVKVGSSDEDNARRLSVMRREIGDACRLMADANQVWEVDESIARVRALAPFNLWWIEEPTSPDDVLGHAKIAAAARPLGIGVATGENCVPICPHTGGVGMCELAQHLSMFDYVAVAGRMDDRVPEYVDHLHDHRVHPVTVRSGRYFAPTAPGYSSEIKDASRREFAFPDGAAWR
jgi:L-fuconate dehydratase